ncbi:MAG TPA: hypothetical protein PK511_08635 [Chitinophagales bacterium]|nr:hypothetical protein [Chitinophagales bacterium]
MLPGKLNGTGMSREEKGERKKEKGKRRKEKGKRKKEKGKSSASLRLCVKPTLRIT